MISGVLYSSKILLMIMTATFPTVSFSVSLMPAPFHPSILSNPHDSSAKVFIILLFLSVACSLLGKETGFIPVCVRPKGHVFLFSLWGFHEIDIKLKIFKENYLEY